MVNLIGKISKGTIMDQIYIPKNRSGLAIGTYVLIKPLEREEKTIKPVFYNVRSLEPVKIGIINEIFKDIEADNVIITGSFLEKGFHFNDIDVVIINEYKVETEYEKLRSKLGIKPHIIQLTNKAFLEGLATDPLYRLMLNKCVSKKRLIYQKQARINYKLLDIHLLKSRLLLDNFDELSGSEKYELLRNMVAIMEFIDKKEIKNIDSTIDKCFGKDTVKNIKNNLVQKRYFLDKYSKLLTKIQSKILQGIENESKQK